MPRFKLKGVLERDPLADLWKHTLCKIPTVFGRLDYLASLRDTRSGSYQHHGLNLVFGRTESKRALSDSHYQIFTEWLCMPLEEKTADLRAYLASLDESQEQVLTHWRLSGQHRTQFPTSATVAEREMYISQLDLLVELMQAERGDGPSDPNSSQPE